MFVESVADLVTVGESGHVVDDPVLTESPDVIHLKYQALHHVDPLIHAVSPVSVDSITGTHRHPVSQQGFAGEFDRLVRSVGEDDGGSLQQTGSAGHPVCPLGTAQPLSGPPVVPDPGCLL